MVVDDDRIIREMLKFVLTSHGYYVMISSRPEQTASNILRSAIDLVLLDQFIFEASGMEVCRELKENKTTGQVPVLMMSAHIGVKKNCLKAGAIDFIAKPFELKNLFSKIETILKQTENN